MNNLEAFERAEDDLVREYNAGLLDLDTFNEEMRNLADEYRWMAEEAAQEAYDLEMYQWLG